MAFLRAIAINGIALFALGVMHVPLTMMTFAIVAIASAMIGVRAFRPLAPRILPASLIIAPFAIAFLISVIVPLADYDGLVTWLPKAKAIAREASITGPFFHGERGLNLHNHYPLLMPLNAAAAMRLLGTFDDVAVRWLYIAIPLAALLAATRRVSPWICAGLAWLPQLVMPEGGMLSAYSDLAVAAFFGMAVLALTHEEHAGLWLAALVLTKNEGVVLAIAALAAAAICKRRLRWRDALPPLGAFALLVAWRMQIPDALRRALRGPRPRHRRESASRRRCSHRTLRRGIRHSHVGSVLVCGAALHSSPHTAPGAGHRVCRRGLHTRAHRHELGHQ